MFSFKNVSKETAAFIENICKNKNILRIQFRKDLHLKRDDDCNLMNSYLSNITLVKVVFFPPYLEKHKHLANKDPFELLKSIANEAAEKANFKLYYNVHDIKAVENEFKTVEELQKEFRKIAYLEILWR